MFRRVRLGALAESCRLSEFGFTHLKHGAWVEELGSIGSGVCFHLFIGAGVLSLIDGSDWIDSKGVVSGTVL